MFRFGLSGLRYSASCSADDFMREVAYRNQQFSHALGEDDSYLGWCRMSYASSDWQANVEPSEEDVSDWGGGSHGETLRCDAGGGGKKLC